MKLPAIYSNRLSYRGNPTFCQPLENDSFTVYFNGEDIQILVEATTDLPEFVVDGKLCTTPGTRDNVGQASIICQGLGAGTHELDIANSQGVNLFICLDSGASTLPLASTTLSSSASGVPGFSVTATMVSVHSSSIHTTSTLSPLLSPSASSPSTEHRAANTWPIVAGTVSSALFLMATIATCWYLLRLRRRRRDRQDTTMPEYVRPFVPSLRRFPPRSRSVSLEKVSIETLSITEATGPTSTGSEGLVSPHAVAHAAVGHHSATGLAPLKLLSSTTGMGDTPWGQSATTAARPHSENTVRQTDSRAEEDQVHLRPEFTETTTGSSVPPLARSESHELGRALTSAPPEVQSGVMRILRSWLSQCAWQEPAQTEVDSGMRFVEDTHVPPPAYTME